MSQEKQKENKQKSNNVWGIVVVIIIVAIGAIFMMKWNTQMNESKQGSVAENVLFIEEIDSDANDLPIVTMTIDGYGTIVAELYPSIAPNTVNNFIKLINEGFYDGLTIHRIVPNFVIQGGDPLGNGMGGPGYSIIGEFQKNGYDQNNLAHVKGVLSMARSNSYDSAGSQFFIVTGDAPHLNAEYSAFGKMIEGYDVLEKLNEVRPSNPQTGELSDSIIINKMEVDLKGKEYDAPIIIK
ncbi:MAG: peptidylprolyl isomerase [Cellulosilyticaceae bacterium]